MNSLDPTISFTHSKCAVRRQSLRAISAGWSGAAGLLAPVRPKDMDLSVLGVWAGGLSCALLEPPPDSSITSRNCTLCPWEDTTLARPLHARTFTDKMQDC